MATIDLLPYKRVQQRTRLQSALTELHGITVQLPTVQYQQQLGLQLHMVKVCFLQLPQDLLIVQYLTMD